MTVSRCQYLYDIVIGRLCGKLSDNGYHVISIHLQGWHWALDMLLASNDNWHCELQCNTLRILWFLSIFIEFWWKPRWSSMNSLLCHRMSRRGAATCLLSWTRRVCGLYAILLPEAHDLFALLLLLCNTSDEYGQSMDIRRCFDSLN